MEFSEWLDSQLRKHGWSRSEAARRGNISASMMDKVINGYSKPGVKFIEGIARAFNIPPEEAFRAAIGITNKSDDQFPEKIIRIVNSYTHPETKVKALDYLQYLATQEEKAEYRVTPTPKDIGET